MKKILSTLLVLCLVLSLAVPVMADETTGTTAATEATTQATEPKPATSGMCGENISWSVDGTTITIKGSGKMYDYSKGETPWAHYKDTLTTVKFSGGVTYVGSFSFHDFDKITSVSLDSKTEELGTSCFQGCDGLTKLTVPFTGKFIMGEDSLRNCKNLKSIDFAGTFPKFKTNCLWDTYATLYYPADNPWPTDTIKELEDAFSGRIEFRSSTGEDPVKPTEAPKETQPKPKPTEGKQPAVTPATTETNTAPTWNLTEQTTPTVTLPRPSYTAPAIEEVENEGGFSGWVAIVIVVGVLAAFAAVTIHVQQQQRKNRRKNRRQRPDFE